MAYKSPEFDYVSEHIAKTGFFLGVKVQTWLDVKHAADRRGLTVEALLRIINDLDGRILDWAKHFSVDSEIERLSNAD